MLFRLFYSVTAFITLVLAVIIFLPPLLICVAFHHSIIPLLKMLTNLTLFQGFNARWNIKTRIIVLTAVRNVLLAWVFFSLLLLNGNSLTEAEEGK